MMSDSVDDVLDNEEAEDEIEDLTSQVIITFSPFQEVYLEHLQSLWEELNPKDICILNMSGH